MCVRYPLFVDTKDRVGRGAGTLRSDIGCGACGLELFSLFVQINLCWRYVCASIRYAEL